MSRLLEIQEWFGKTISKPLNIAPERAESYIAPSPTLEPHERIRLYQQQYWWRLLDCLQENFPRLTKKHGPEGFNKQIGIPYLTENPPTHWALCQLGQSLPAWLEKRGEDASVAHIDAAAQRAFWIGGKPAVYFATLSPKETLTKKLHLQPHVYLYREEERYFVLYRNQNNEVKYKEMSEGEYRFLGHFREGCTIEEACEREAHTAEASELLPLWFREWTYLTWFCEG